MAVPALIQVEFDPLFEVGELLLSWQSVGVTVALLFGVALAARGRARSSAVLRRDPAGRARRTSGKPGAPPAAAGGRLIEAQPLRLDDLGYILLASIPGAVVVGRLVHGIAFWPAYAGQPELLLDPARGSLSLLGAVLGGAFTGALMVRLLHAPVRRWADTAAIPLLVTLGLGKLAQFLAGSGQGAPFDGPWAVVFAGEGPWVSANAGLPSHPAQLYEAAWLLLGAMLLLSLAGAVRGHPSRSGALFAMALVLFLLGRVAVGFTWRDERIAGPFNAEQLLALAALGLGLIVLIVWAVAQRRSASRRTLPMNQ